jgi:hypothetical protein
LNPASLNATDPASPLYRLGHGTTLQLTDVISFDVRLLKYHWQRSFLAPSFTDAFEKTFPPGSTTPFNPDNPADPGWAYYKAKNEPPWAFDTTYGAQAGNDKPEFCIAALEISIRVWDAKTEQARQVTIIQDM